MPFAITQTIHVADGRARMVAQHAAILDTASRHIFGRPYRPDIAELTRRIERLAASAHHPVGLSSFVEISLDKESETLTDAGASLYDGYALRSLTPDAVTVPCEIPVSTAPTSARRAISEMADAAACRQGVAVGLCHRTDGTLTMADNAPLFGIASKQLYAAEPILSVERELMVALAPKLGFTIADETLKVNHIPHLDELFYIDHRGITSLAHCNGYPLMVLRTERIAATLERLFSKK